jgi:arylsulfatase A-like enzyme
LQGGGYRTSMMGKYLNGYDAWDNIPHGWTNWQVSGGGYRGFNYELSSNGAVAHFGRSRRAYMTDVLRRRGKAFISRASRSGSPFMLEVATYAPHKPAVPAPRDSHDFPGLTVPHDATFDQLPEDAPNWLRNRQPLQPQELDGLNKEFRRRAQSVQAVDEMVGQVRRLLRQRGLEKNTYVFFSSDNGYHMGERRLLAGKMTAYDSDIRVPLIAVGPGIKHGTTTSALAENIDLAPTFMRLAGVKPAHNVDGHGLVNVLHGHVPSDWRDEVLIEHHHPQPTPSDPDVQAVSSGNPPSYEALRTEDFLYVEYVTGDREWYDLTTDPFEMDNLYDRLDSESRRLLHERLTALQQCSGEACRIEAIP